MNTTQMQDAVLGFRPRARHAATNAQVAQAVLLGEVCHVRDSNRRAVASV
jgi:hypothetical protein